MGALPSIGHVVDDTLGTHIMGANATDRAIDAQTNAANSANGTLASIYQSQRNDSQPWRDQGLAAMSDLSQNKFMDNFQGDPGYQFRLNEGLKAVNASASARGNSQGGANLKALTRYGQDYASSEYNNAYNRNFNRLNTIANYGNQATTSLMGAAQNYGNQVSANQIGVGNANAAANTAQANRMGNLIGQGVGAAGMAFSDERLKTNISNVEPLDLQEMKKHLKAYAFNYKSDEFGKGDWVGVMAQDLEKSKLGKTLVVENEAGHKMIDLKKVLSMFLATMAEV